MNFHATIGNGLFGRRSVRTLRKGDLIRILAGSAGAEDRVEMEVKNESKSIRKTDLRKVQSHQKERFHQNYL